MTRENPAFTFARPRAVAAAMLLALPAIALMAACASDPAIPSVTDAEHEAAWMKWRDTRTAWLETPGRPVSYTGLTWLVQGANTIGSDSTNRVQLIARDVPARVGTLVREGNRVRFEPADAAVAAAIRIDSAALPVDSAPRASATWLRTDGDQGGASRVEIGAGGWRILKRVDSIGVRTWDADLSTKERIAQRFAPLSYFPRDSAWRVAGMLELAAKPETIAFATTAGVDEIHIVLGTVRFTLAGKPQSLTAMAGTNAKDLYFTFSDETSGEETYGFRFLHAALDSATKTVVMDFNFAYNPDCAFSGYTTCPLPPQENRLPVRITAGELVAVHREGSAGPKPTPRK